MRNTCQFGLVRVNGTCSDLNNEKGEWPDEVGESYGGGGGGGGSGDLPEKVTIDPSCSGVGPANDRGVQRKALDALHMALTEQQRDPLGPDVNEYGFTGRPYFLSFIYGKGFVTSDIKPGVVGNVTVVRGYFDTFDVHTHAGRYDNPFPSDDDKETTPAGNASIIIDRNAKLRCYIGK